MQHMEQIQMIKDAIEAGLDRHETKRELISQGFETSHFDELYASALSELGVNEPTQKIPPYIAALRNDSGVSPVFVGSSLPVSMSILIQHGIRVASMRWRFLLFVSTLLFIPGLVYVLIQSFLPSLALFNLVLVLLNILISVLCWGAIIFMGAKGHEEVTRVHAFQWATGNLLSLLWVVLFLSFSVIGGLVFFILPGLAIMVASIFVFTVMAHENARGTHALMRSLDLVRGTFGATTLRMIALVLTVELPVWLLGIFIHAMLSSLMTLPFAFAAIVIQVALSLIGFSILARMYLVRKQVRPLFEYSTYTGMKWLYRLLFLVGVGVTMSLIIFFNGIAYISSFPALQQLVNFEIAPSHEGEDTRDRFNVGDVLARSRVETTAASAKIFGNRMIGDYTGACSDITVVEPVICRAINTSFVVYAPLAEGYHCVDATGFSGTVAYTAEYSCQ